MKYLDEYRDERIARALAAEIAQRVTRPWALMEICGGQTHTIMRYGIDDLLPEGVELVHGPGCPVCVTPLETIDKAIELASRPQVTLVSYGDMLRVPGSETDLFQVKAKGGDVRVVYSPLEAVKLARALPTRKVVFLAIGFETTAPANAMAAWQAKQSNLENFSLLVSHVLVPPAIRLLLKSPQNRVQAFIAPGHVCTVMGYTQYEQLVAEFRVPIVVGGKIFLQSTGADGKKRLLLCLDPADGKVVWTKDVPGRAIGTGKGQLHPKNTAASPLATCARKV